MKSFKEWLCEATDIPSIPAKEAAKIWKDIKQLTGLGFKNKRFTDNYYRVQDEISRYRFSIMNGILVLEGDVIPNYEQVIKYLKTKFEDVDLRRQDYINCRGFGATYKVPTGTIENKELKPLPNPETLQGKPMKEVLNIVREALHSRDAKVEGRPPLRRIGRMGDYNIVGFEGRMYVYSVTTLYQIKDLEEAKHLIRIAEIYHQIMRHLEVQSWRQDDLSDPNGRDVTQGFLKDFLKSMRPGQ